MNKIITVDIAKPSENPEDVNFEFRPLIDLFSFAESGSELPTRIKLIPVGEYNMGRYGKVSITKDKVDEMVKHFNENVRAHTNTIGLPIDVEHGTTQWKDAATGWIKQMYSESDGGWGDVEWTPLGKKLLMEKLYKLYSPEFFFEYIDPQYGYQLKNVMTGGGLVNKPMIKDDLPPIVNSEGKKIAQEKNLTNDKTTITLFMELEKTPTRPNLQIMKLSEIVAKEKTARNSDEQKFLIEHQDELTFAEAKKEGLVPEKAKEKEVVTPPATGQVLMAEAEVTKLREDAAAGKSAHEQLRKQNLTAEVTQIVLTEKGSKLPTDQIEKSVDLLMTMSETQAAAYKEQLKSIPTPAQFTEVGSDNALNMAEDPGKQWSILVNARAAEKKMKFSEAEDELSKEQPALFAAAYQVKVA